MKERPITFSGPMVRAILEGRKTQTRRVVQPQPTGGGTIHAKGMDHGFIVGRLRDSEDAWRECRCPYGVPGDRLWVKETWADECDATSCPDDRGATLYRATDPGWDDSDTGLRWQSPIFMPRQRSRITLEVVRVRVERLQEITEPDAIAEGSTASESRWSAIVQFRSMWEQINFGRGYGWASNPWVWVIEFNRVIEVDGGRSTRPRGGAPTERLP